MNEINDKPNTQLTERELEILRIVLDGCSTKECAEQLSVSVRTISFHLNNAYRKLHVNNRLKAYHEVKRLGLV